MSKSRSTLLIALVLAGTLGMAAGSAHADLSRLGVNPADPMGRRDAYPGATPNAGEPDKPEQTNPRMNMNRTDRYVIPGVPSGSSDVALKQWFRVAWVIWMARYLNPNP